MTDDSDPDDLLATLALTDYEEQSLERLIELGRTTAPDLAEATGIPKARIYGVLESLADDGYVEIIPGRPKEYQPKPPDEILDAAVEARRQRFESYRHDVEGMRASFVETFQPLYDRASNDTSATEELFHVVSVGDPSERETRRLYRDASDRIHVFTKSFAYLDAIEPALESALDRSLAVRVLCLDPQLLEPDNRDVQADIVDRLRTDFPAIDVRFSATRLPWRGTIVDPSLDYESGQAVFLVEEEDIPLHKRQAAVTDNPSFVAGLDRYFDLTWRHDTLNDDPYAE
jgi:sugar-specific transcriptional regulator TrmB